MNQATDKDIAYLRHMVEMCERARDFSGGILETLEEHNSPWFATLRALQLMAESCTHLSEDTQAKMPEIDVQRIRGFRNIIVHDYLGDIDPEIVRNVIKIELPKLQTAAARCLKEITHDT